ncbi:unnamed protein product [Lymnaea stagnalis]|uniref:Zinc finger CCCH-type with G patch domain-containing protein n=1 Tax=Lymnaea stagnalis TaxID=6523 RepID=A0AAV2H580_LYMST
MSQTEEADQEASLELYNLQLSQVEQAIQVAGESPDLNQLRNDLQELIDLTKDNLLQLKKARLLKSLEDHPTSWTSGADPQASGSDTIEDEYAAFQASLSSHTVATPKEELSQSSGDQNTKIKSEPQSSSNLADSPDDSDDDSNSDDESSSDDETLDASYFSHLVGTKCRAPFFHDWGGHHYGNAMIWSVEPPLETDDADNFKVRVIFLNPIHPSIIPCKYFMDSSCRFSDDECRRSHGHPVRVSELKPYVEPDHSKICEGCRCLAKFTDDVWYPGTVNDVCDDHQVNVQFDAQRQECTILVEHVLPLESAGEDGSGSDSDGGDRTSHRKPGSKFAQEEEEEDELPGYLWQPAQTTDKLGAWETHTKGIGSKLMAKMGYITGQGLGPQGTGRAEPVPIQLLPQGKSLDKIMELKEMAGNADLFNAMKKLEKRQKLMEKKQGELEEKRKGVKENWGVFGFINNKLGEKEGPHGQHRPGHSKVAQATHASEKDLSKRSDKDVNVQIFKTAEEMKKVQKNLEHLKQQLSRNLSRDKKVSDAVSQKISEQEKYLQQLQTSSQTLETHRDRRKAHQKLTIF